LELPLLWGPEQSWSYPSSGVLTRAGATPPLTLFFLPWNTLAAGAFGFRRSPRGSGERRRNAQVQKFIKMKNIRTVLL
ncbi:hypothetical protein KUCAC02_026188, partial [Chaenocephalus aceratus]